MTLLLLACAADAVQDAPAPDSACDGQTVYGTVRLWGQAYGDAQVFVRVDGADAYQLLVDREDGTYRTSVPADTPVGLMAQDPDGTCQTPEQTVTVPECASQELDLTLDEECVLPG